MEITHPTYEQLLEKIPEIKNCFNVDFLAVPDEEFRLLRLSKLFFPNPSNCPILL